MPEVERSAQSVEEAVEAALAELGVSEQEAVVEVVHEPRASDGSGPQQAIVRVRTIDHADEADMIHDGDTIGAGGTGEVGEPDASDDREDQVDDSGDDQADVAADFVEDLLDRMGISAEVEITDVDGVTYIDVWGEDEETGIGALIGRRGATLDGIQELVRSVVQQQVGERCMVVVDVEDYRKRRRSQVIRAARTAASKAEQSGREVALEPMSAFERKIVHDTVSEIEGLETASEGDEPNRRVVIRPTT